MSAERVLRVVFLLNAVGTLFAAPCVLMPFAWMDAIHRDWLGLGSLPDAPITRYLARSLSLFYALHAVLLLAIALDWQRHRPLVRVVACIYITFGVVMAGVDIDAGMPWWWTAVEASFALFGAFLLALYHRASRDVISVL